MPRQIRSPSPSPPVTPRDRRGRVDQGCTRGHDDGHRHSLLPGRTGRRVLLVEADPFGGDLAAWFGVAPSTGLWSLLAAGRRGLDSDAVWEHATTLPTGLPVLYGLASADQAVANEAAWPAVAEALAALDADVIIDAGRLLPHFAGGIRPLLSVAEVLVRALSPHPGGHRPSEDLPALAHRCLTVRAGSSCSQLPKGLFVRRDRINPDDQRRTAHPTRSQGRRRPQRGTPLGGRTRRPRSPSGHGRNAAELAASLSGPAATQDPLSIPEIRDQPPRPSVNDTETPNDTEHLHDTEHLQNTVHSDAPTWAAR